MASKLSFRVSRSTRDASLRAIFASDGRESVAEFPLSEGFSYFQAAKSGLITDWLEPAPATLSEEELASYASNLR